MHRKKANRAWVILVVFLALAFSALFSCASQEEKKQAKTDEGSDSREASAAPGKGEAEPEPETGKPEPPPEPAREAPHEKPEEKVKNDDPAARELIRDRFKGAFMDFYMGNASPADLYRAVRKALEDLEEFPRTEWNEKFETEIMGLDCGRVECAEWFLKLKMTEASRDPENMEAARKAIQEAADFLEPVNREKLQVVKVGGTEADYKQYYDEAKAKIDRALEDLESLAGILRRKPPGGPVDLVAADENLWVKEGEIQAAMGGDGFTLEAKKRGDRITATHYYLKNFTLKVTFVIRSGGFDVILRSLPGKKSPFYAGFMKEQLPDPDAPFTMIFEMVDSTMKITDSEGRDLMDPLRTDRGPKGGGIMIRLVSPGSSVIFKELVLTPR